MNKSGILLTFALLATSLTYPSTNPRLDGAVNVAFNAVGAAGVGCLLYYLYNQEQLDTKWQEYNKKNLDIQPQINDLEAEISESDNKKCIAKKRAQIKALEKQNQMPWDVQCAFYGSIVGLAAIIGWGIKAATKVAIEYSNS